MAGNIEEVERRIAEAAWTKARHLDLRGFELSELPESLSALTCIETLLLEGNQVAVLPEWVGELTNLMELNLQGNQLTVLPESFGALTKLAVLDLYNNRLTALPESLGALTNLRRLYLGANSLAVLPESLGSLPSLEHLVFELNPLLSPPPDICAGGMIAVLAFLRDSASTPPGRLWASKLLIVGEATVGKTSLAKQLTGGEYDPDEVQTHGVHVDPLLIPHPSEPDTTMNLTVWDFGGQLEYRATQRFYLTDRSLFILVWNARARWRDGKVIAWLDVIAARAPESPILIVATHGDEPSAATLPEDLRGRYPQIVGVHTVDAKSCRGIDSLREAVQREAAVLPLMGVTWPKPWVNAANAVRGLEGYAATANQAWKTMAAVGVADHDSQQAIARALHDLGDIVFFADDRELSQRMILHPNWLDARITAALDSQAIADARGVMTRTERDRIWGDLDDPDLLDRLIRMMERFDLAYRIGDAADSENVALVVERLGDSRPAEVDLRWSQARQEPGVHEIGIAYRLKSRQAGIPTWFIAREHQYTAGLHWSQGALFYDRDPDAPAYALLVDDEREQPTVTLTVCGKFPVRFLSVLAEAFENILDHRYPGLIEQRLVPCACQGIAASPCAHLFGLEELILEATDTDPDANHKVRCPRSKLKIDARVMLDGLHGSGVSEQIDALHHVLADQATTLARVDAHNLATLNGIRALLAHRAQIGVHCPSLFAVEDLGRSKLRRNRGVQLKLWCEWPYGPQGPHALAEDVGVYNITSLPKWLRDYLPYLRVLVTALGIAAPIIAPALIALGKPPTDRAQAGLDIADQILDAAGKAPDQSGVAASYWARTSGLGPMRRAEDGADFRTLRNALHELDPQEHWGGLSPVARPEDRRIVYLCREHVRALEYPYRSPTE